MTDQDVTQHGGPFASRTVDSNPTPQPPPTTEPPPPTQTKKPNVKLAASKEDSALSEGRLNIGPNQMMIPDKEGQLAGFYTEHPGVLVAQFRQFKFIQKKGEAQDSTVTL